jgi:hypothetical protein
MVQTPSLDSRGCFQTILVQGSILFTSVLGSLSNAPLSLWLTFPDHISLWLILYVWSLLDPWPGATGLPCPKRLD